MGMQTTTAETTETLYDILTMRNGTQEVHACGCAHSKPLCDRDTAKYFSQDIKSLCREIAIEFNFDLAGDHDMTPEAYVDSGKGWEVSTKPKAHIRIMPCVKFNS